MVFFVSAFAGSWDLIIEVKIINKKRKQLATGVSRKFFMSVSLAYREFETRLMALLVDLFWRCVGLI